MRRSNRPVNPSRCAPTAILAGLLISVPSVAAAPITFQLSFEGLAGASNPTTSDLEAALRTNAISGFEHWTRWLNPAAPRSLEVVIRIQDYPTGTGGGSSATSAFVTNEGGLDIFEEGAAHEIRTGNDPNADAPDVTIFIDPEYLRDELWFDPAPADRQTPIAAHRIDAVSFFAHEFGHTLGFNGWGDTANGTFPGNYRSRFNHHAQWDGVNWSYTGPVASALYGGPVPLSRVANNHYHYGNPVGSGAPGAEPKLINGLMNGVVFLYQARYSVGLLDLAFLQDQALPLASQIRFAPPTPSIAMTSVPLLQWPTLPLGDLRLQGRDSLTETWKALSSNPFPSVEPGISLFEDDLTPGAQRFYRLILEP